MADILALRSFGRIERRCVGCLFMSLMWLRHQLSAKVPYGDLDMYVGVRLMEAIDTQLRQWSTAGMLLLACAALMAGTLLIGR